ncbi:hypothetical protein [Ilumatobacter sp.]|uniref:hypothetical protein n=1 Tax=Ilumatobacter sp. TaxID=1967498 RepID=UPI003B525DC3
MWAAKGGAGTTVTACAAAIHEPDDVLLVDLASDCATVLGAADRELGVRAWLTTDLEPERLIEFTDPIDDTTRLIGAGRLDPDHGNHRPERLRLLAGWLVEQPGVVIVDAGTGTPPDPLLARAQRSILVTRADYLAVLAATRTGLRPDEVFVVNEPGRALTHHDLERAIGAPVTGDVDLDPAIARAVDAGLFVGHRTLRRATETITARTQHSPRLRGPDIDYGMRWRTRHNPDTWRVSYNTGDQLLQAVNNRTGLTVPLVGYRTTDRLEADIDGWATRHADPDGLDWLTTQLGIPGAIPHTAPEPIHPTGPQLDLPGIEL